MNGNFPIFYQKYNSNIENYSDDTSGDNMITIIRVLSGALTVTIEKENHTLTRGNAIYIDTNLKHSLFPTDCTYEVVSFCLDIITQKDSVTDEFISSIKHHKYIVYPTSVNTMRYKFNIIDFIFEAMSHKVIGYEYDVIGGLYILYGYILRNKLYQLNSNYIIENKVNSYRYKEIIDYMKNKYMDNITLDSLADLAEMNPRYFCRFFKLNSGLTPINYLNQIRIEKACELLNTGNYTVNEAATATGFNDTSYFIKVFKKQIGITPKLYAQEGIKNQGK